MNGRIPPKSRRRETVHVVVVPPRQDDQPSSDDKPPGYSGHNGGSFGDAGYRSGGGMFGFRTWPH